VCVVDGRNEDGCEPSVRWKLCKVQLCLVGGKLLVKEMRSPFRNGNDDCTVDTEVETPQGKAYVVVSARRWVQGYRVWDEVVAGLENVNGVEDVFPLFEWATKTVKVQGSLSGGDGRSPTGASECDVECEGWSRVDGIQVVEGVRSLGKRELFSTSWQS
jgi:hypothetical protein